MVRQNKTGQQAAEGGSQDVAQVQVRNLRADVVVRVDPDVGDQGKDGPEPGGRQGHQDETVFPRQAMGKSPAQGRNDEESHRIGDEREENDAGNQVVSRVPIRVTAIPADSERSEGQSDQVGAQQEAKGVSPTSGGEGKGPVPKNLVRERDGSREEGQEQPGNHAGLRRRAASPMTPPATVRLMLAARITVPPWPRCPRIHSAAAKQPKADPSVLMK